MHLLLVGNYGVGNFGDEALREYMLRSFPTVEWTVLSAYPRGNELPRLPFGFRSLFRPWWRTIAAIARSDGIVFGGGTLFTDVESVVACALWGLHVAVARLFRKPVYLVFQGIGPVRTRLGRAIVRRVVASASFLSVRDAQSADRASAWRENKKIIQSHDPVFSLFEAKNSDSSSTNVLTIIPRRNSGSSFRFRAEELAWRTPRTAVRILSLQPDDPDERRVCDLLARTTGGEIYPIRRFQDLEAGVRGSMLVLSQRYHGAVAALALGTPLEVMPQGKGDKLDALPLAADMPDVRTSIATAEQALRSALGLL